MGSDYNERREGRRFGRGDVNLRYLSHISTLLHSQPALLALFEKHKDSRGKQAKLKTPTQLQELLDVTKEVQQQLWSRKVPLESGKAADEEVSVC